MDARNLINGDNKAANIVLFAHGAGAGMEHRFMQYFAAGMAIAEWQVIRFEFPYMQQIKTTGTRRPPNPQQLLLETWREKVQQFRSSGRLILAGKSMGGRMASIIADGLQADGLLLFGYPFHPAGKPLKLRTEHLKKIETRCLILQGEIDPLGNRVEVGGYSLSEKIRVKWLKDGDHGFKPRKKSGYTEQQNWQQALKFAREFINSIGIN